MSNEICCRKSPHSNEPVWCASMNSHFSRRVIVAVGASKAGKTGVVFVDAGANVARNYTQGKVTSQNLWSWYDRHAVGITWRWCVELKGEDLWSCSHKIESVSLRKCSYDHWLTNKSYLSAILDILDICLFHGCVCFYFFSSIATWTFYVLKCVYIYCFLCCFYA